MILAKGIVITWKAPDLGAGGRRFESSRPDQFPSKGTKMTAVRIYRPTKTVMQSGRWNVKRWVLEFEPEQAKETDPLMGWIGSADTREQVRLRFENKEEAIAFAKKNGMTTLFDSGIKLVEEGITSFEEVCRISVE